MMINIFTQSVILLLLTLVPLLLLVAAYTLSERKVRALIQRRWGPDYVGFFGVMQPIADAIKLLTKQTKIPSKVNRIVYKRAPIVGLLCSLTRVRFRQFNVNTTLLAERPYSLMAVLVIRSLGSYSVIFGGWASNSKYAVLGALRGVTQLIAYDLFLIFSIVMLFRITSSFSIHEIALRQNEAASFAFIIPIAAIGFMLACIRETNRIPYDLSEAEAELVAGYNVEYGSIYFLMYFLAEYFNMFRRSRLNVLLFFGGFTTWNWLSRYGNQILYYIKVIILSQLLIIIRALRPRYRYDQRRRFGWKIMLPSRIFIFPATYLRMLVILKVVPIVLSFLYKCYKALIYHPWSLIKRYWSFII